MLTVQKVLEDLKKFQDYENKGFPSHLKSFKSKVDWIKQQKES